MIFENSKKSLFDNNDEFGVQGYRSDQTHLFNQNTIKVKHIVWNTDKQNTGQGDFLGTVLLTEATLEDDENIIEINIMSHNPTFQELSRDGYSGRGEVTYECFASYDLEIGNQDFIVFLTDYDDNLKTGEKYRVKMDDCGLYQGQFTRKQFTISMIKKGI